MAGRRSGRREPPDQPPDWVGWVAGAVILLAVAVFYSMGVR